jgi:hypothetical protein
MATGALCREILTSGALGVLLDVLALLDELVLGGAGKAALDRGAKPGSEARRAADELAGVHVDFAVGYCLVLN